MERKMEKNISDLAHHLKQEKLFIASEKNHLVSLNRKLMKTIENVYQASFIRGEHQRNYYNLVLQPHSAPTCCQKSNQLSQLQFTEGYQALGYLDTLFGEALSRLRENPRLCAHCLVVGEALGQDAMHLAAATVFASVYGNCILPEDEVYLLLVLNNLIELQLSSSENPRRLLLHGSCAFSQVYRAYIDTLPQAKVFLTAALHEPILQLLMKDELFLDIDPANAAGRFPPEERLKRFGQKGTPSYEAALAKYRLWTINKLVDVTNRFIESIRCAMQCFPSTLAWLVRSVHQVLLNAKNLTEREVSSLCVDLVFTFFICSAIVSPEPHGIVDAPISHISRFNLIQVAQILQALAMNRWEEPDQRFSDLYEHLDKKVLSGLFEVVIGSGIPEQPPVATSGNCPLTGLSRSSFMIPDSHLVSLFNFLFQVQERLPETSTSNKDLAGVLRPLKPHFDQFQMERLSLRSNGIHGTALHNSTSPHDTPKAGGSSPADGQNLTMDTLPGNQKKNILTCVRSSRKRKMVNPEPSQDTPDDSASSVSQSGAISHSGSHPSSLQSQQSSSLEDKEEGGCAFSYATKCEAILVIPLPSNLGRRECPGMMSEEKVLASIKESKSTERGAKPRSEEDRAVVSGGGDGPIEKRTRFSLSHDDGSIGNTSDNLYEAISEAASNHSVASSLDDVEQVDQPDNLSDMVSANVSGRGTPNVSGRDTPSSQIAEGDEGPARGSGEAPRGGRSSNLAGSGMTKEEGAGIEDKFGKFEIKPIPGAGDETTSLVSDTWSTDVLASDSEIIENRIDDVDLGGASGVGAGGGQSQQQQQQQLLDRHLVELDRMHRGRSEFLLTTGDGTCGGETASEAWSTDVLASDSERLTEVDTDDAQSVARSDDAGRSEVEVELVIGDAVVPSTVGSLLPGKGLVPGSEGPASPKLTSFKSVESEGVDGVSESEKGRHDDREDSPSAGVAVGALKVTGEGRKGLRFTPVTRITEDTHPTVGGFEPIRSPGLDCPTRHSEDTCLRERAPEASAIQSLGRLSLTLSDLPSNGMVGAGQPLVFNQIPGQSAEACFPQKQRKIVEVNNLDHSSESSLSLQPTKEGNRATLPTGKVLSDEPGVNNIHLSTTSLASSGSSESDGPLSQPTKDAHHPLPQQQHPPLSALASSEVSPTAMHDPISSSSASSSSFSSLASTGAIPKSISFDKTAERGDRDMSVLPDGDCIGAGKPGNNKKGFFKVFRLPPFKARRQKVGSGGFSSSGGNRSAEEYTLNRSSLSSADGMIRRSLSDENRRTIIEESTDEILAKYRKKPDEGSGNELDAKPIASATECTSPAPELRKDARPFSAAVCESSSYAFRDAKRKLRTALSSADFTSPFYSVYFSSSELLHDDDILARLKTQLAEAQNLQDRSLVAQLHETIRCLNLFDQQGRETIQHSLKEDYHRRSPYIAYLIRSRQGLLNSIAHLEKLLLRLETDTGIITTSMVNVCVRMFLEKRDDKLNHFTKSFMQLTVPDEKVELVETFLTKLYSELERDPMWISSTPGQLSLAQLCLERCIMSHIYILALYPNGDGDVSRDQVLFEHMKKLSAVITPNHKDLGIPKHYQYECPWPSAQAELTCLSAYKTSEDKVRCVVRASKTIMNLLSMGQETSVPSADDFIPVLVYVLIKANPPCLLSTVQYVDLFYDQRLHGEDRYWWTQFCSSIEFIKTMDYTP